MVMSIYFLLVLCDRKVKGDIYYLGKIFKIVNEYVKGLGFSVLKILHPNSVLNKTEIVPISSDNFYMV